MSVTIYDYLVVNDNKLTALLEHEGLKNVFLENTVIDVHKRQEEWWCDFFMNYTLSCNDLAAIAATFAGYWWCVSPCADYMGYRLSVNLRNDLK